MTHPTQIVNLHRLWRRSDGIPPAKAPWFFPLPASDPTGRPIPSGVASGRGEVEDHRPGVSYPLHLTKPTAELFVPDGTPLEEALMRTTELAIGAHQDDLEIMAYHGIARCFGRADRWFSGITVTNGAGSPRQGHYAALSEEQMLLTRRREQKKAAVLGEYAAVALLDHPSPEVRDSANPSPTEDLLALLEAAAPRIIYTHNLADKHDAHVAVALRTLSAVRRLPPELQPQRLLGCEVWRDLDWLAEGDKVALAVGERENLAAALLGLYDSQIEGGKRYDLAAVGRRRAHATYHDPLATDAASQLTFAMDLTPLVADPSLDPQQFLSDHIERFCHDCRERFQRLGSL